MFFIVLTFFSALFIEGLSSVISVIGISKLFGANPLIMALAVALDVGKIVTASIAYTYWGSLPKLMRGYALLAAAITMIITSAGAAGYLSGEFQKAVIGAKEGEHKVAVLKEQQARYLERKKQIDDQIAKLPERTTVNQRLRLMRGFDAEQKSLNAKIAEIDKQLPQVQLEQIGVEAKAGPILYVAKALDISVEQAVKWVILLIIFVFDPLAIFLIISGNFLWAQRKLNARQPHATTSIEARTIEEPVTPSLTPEPVLAPGDLHRSEHVPLEPEPHQPIFTELQPTPQQSSSLPEEGSWNEDFVFYPSVDTPQEEKSIDAPSAHTFATSGLLKPIAVEPLSGDGEFPSPPVIRARSSLGSVIPDPKTIVDAHFTPGFKTAQTVATPAIKRPPHGEDV